jgi:nitric oxide reductase activation protein
MLPLRLAAPVALLLLPGCLAKTAVDIVTLPVKVVGKGVSAALPSQKKRDQKRGKAIRKYEECLGKEQRKAAKDRRPADETRCGGAP